MKWRCVIASAVMAMALAPSAGWADTIDSVEGARAKERQGRWLSSQDRDQLRRWGGNDDARSYGYGRYERPYYGYSDGPVYYYRARPY